jgi:hypothetical protein
MLKKNAVAKNETFGNKGTVFTMQPQVNIS